MTAATLPRIDRSTKAAGIVERHECIPLDNGSWEVRDTATGSGKVHIATSTSCDCPDSIYRGHQCKHIRAVQRESQLLTAYSVSWDDWAAAQRACCPVCGAAIEAQQWYIGGRGYLWFNVCPRSGEHYSKPA